MPTIQQLIDSGSLLISKGETKLVNSTRAAEALVYLALLEIFNNVEISNGKLSSSPKAEEFLASLDARVFYALRKSGYGKAVTDFTGNFTGISDNVVDLQQKLGNGLIPATDINIIKRLEVNKTIANLTEQGMYNDFIAPVRQGIYRNILYGSTVDETKELIKSYVVSNKDRDSRLVRYVGQVAADSLHQYDGSINQQAKLSLGLNAVQYVGSLIEDSRAQCQKWVSMAIIKDDELDAEIEFAITNQQYGNKKCSGMIPGTNASTFCVNRGGYRCRHRAIGIRLVKPKK